METTISSYQEIAKLFPFKSEKLKKEIVFDITTFKSVRKSTVDRRHIIAIYTIRRSIAEHNNNEHLYHQFGNLVNALEKVDDEKISFVSLNIKTDDRFFYFIIFTNIQFAKILYAVELGFNEEQL